jgi:predicted ATPase
VRGRSPSHCRRNHADVPQQDATKAEAYFERSLAAKRQQQAKSWELRAAMSLARLWRDQGKVQQRANFWLRCKGGSLKASTRAI